MGIDSLNNVTVLDRLYNNLNDILVGRNSAIQLFSELKRINHGSSSHAGIVLDTFNKQVDAALSSLTVEANDDFGEYCGDDDYAKSLINSGKSWSFGVVTYNNIPVTAEYNKHVWVPVHLEFIFGIKNEQFRDETALFKEFTRQYSKTPIWVYVGSLKKVDEVKPRSALETAVLP